MSGNVTDGRGGGIDNFGAGSSVHATFCTIAYNRAGDVGGGIHGADGDTGAVSLQTTILWGKRAVGSSPDCSGTLASLDYNLIGSTSGCTLTGPTTNDRSGDPLLGALQQNGGGIATHPLRPGSDAMDRVPSGVCAALTPHDERGSPRPADGTATGSTSCDIGAYEAGTPIVVNSLLDPSEAGKCTLRDAIAAANTNAVVNGCAAGSATSIPDRIVFAVSGRIRLTGSPLSATQGVAIEGPGATKLTVSGEHVSAVFTFSGPDGDAFGVSGLTTADGSGGFGPGGINFSFLPATLALDRVALEDNTGSPTERAFSCNRTEASRSTPRASRTRRGREAARLSTSTARP